jgi:hypothetical protein
LIQQSTYGDRAPFIAETHVSTHVFLKSLIPTMKSMSSICPHSRTWLHAALLLIPALLLAGQVAAGPVGAQEMPAGTSPGDAGPTLSPSLSAPVEGEPLAGGATKVAATPQAGASPSATALAAEIIKEAQAGAVATEATRAASRPAGANPGAHTAAREAPFGGELREWGKAAVIWLKESIPWLRKNDDDERQQQGTALGAADGTESPIAVGKVGLGDRNDVVPAVGVIVTTGPDTSVGYGSAPRAIDLPQTDLIREFIDTVRTVFEHPLTWLVMALFVIGGIAVKKLDRRPTK